jgi:hypothetical protein
LQFAVTPNASGTSDEICGYRVVGVLASQRGCIGETGNGRKVVLKLLEEDCLLKGQLHPSIKERLARVRELPQLQVANLISVERDQGQAYLIWEFLEGQTFEEFYTTRWPRDVILALREVVLCVEAMHLNGMVHGALHGRNIVIDRDARVRVTHLSPLLYTDPAEDERAMMHLIQDIVAKRGWERTGLGEIVQQSLGHPPTMRDLRAKLSAMIESRDLEAQFPTISNHAEEDVRTRRKAVYSAVAVACVGGAVALGAWLYARQGVADVPDPIEADPAAMRRPPAETPSPQGALMPGGAEVRAGS